MAATVWLLTDAASDIHAADGHPERPARRVAVAAGVRDAAGELLREPEIEPIDDRVITLVHDPAYLAFLDAAEARGGGWLDGDTYLVPGSMRAARVAAAATVQAAMAAARGDAAVAFAVVRPPGHHASTDRGSGFCLLNSIAIAVAALRGAGAASRVAIVDWDVHHGDGTQGIFESDVDLCYASTHQMPLFPGTGGADERGAAGTLHNRPLAPGTGDTEFVATWRDDLLRAIEDFGPDTILVSAGFDGHVDDPLANLELTEEGYGEVARLVGELAARLGHAGVALTLEGGYDLRGIRASASATVRGLLGGLRGV